MFIKSCIAHLCHLPGFNQVGHSPWGTNGYGHLGVSGGVRVYWGLAVTPGTQGPEGYSGIRGIGGS